MTLIDQKNLSAEGLDEGSDVDLFFFEKVNTEENPFLLSLQQLRTSHEYCMCILAMFTMLRSTLRKIPSFLSLKQLRTSHEYCMCILAMFMMSRKDLKHVNRPSLAV